MRYAGLLFRALNPVFARQPLSGEGARRYGGRFNAKGVPALYASRHVATAIREANQVGTLQPTTIVAYEVDIGPVFDATEPDLLRAEGLSDQVLAAPDWRQRMLADGVSPTQQLAARLVKAGYVGLQVRSFAKGATPEDLNLVLWRWGTSLPARVRVVDDEGRLG